MSKVSLSSRSATSSGGPRGLVARHPIASFLVLALGLGLTLLTIPVILDVDGSAFLLGLVFLALLAPSLIVTRLADGPGGVRRLLSRTIAWRFSPTRWAVILFGMPVLTLGFAAASGGLVSPPDGWLVMGGWYLFNTLIFGALIHQPVGGGGLGRLHPDQADGASRAARELGSHRDPVRRDPHPAVLRR